MFSKSSDNFLLGVLGDTSVVRMFFCIVIAHEFRGELTYVSAKTKPLIKASKDFMVTSDFVLAHVSAKTPSPRRNIIYFYLDRTNWQYPSAGVYR